MSPPNDRIDLFAGWPAPSLLPVSLLKDAAVTALSDPSIFFPGFGYGPDEGYEPLRKNVANWMTEFYLPAEPVSLKHICITGGASQNIACILQVYTDPAVTRCVWMVEPAYYLARRIFEDAGFGDGRIRGIRGGDDAEQGGIDLTYLENALEDVERQWHQRAQTQPPMKPTAPHRKIYSHVIYCVPTFSNPSGVTMPKTIRRALVRLARKHDILILCDDVYDFLLANPGNEEATSPLPRIVDIDKVLDGGPHDFFGNVVSNGSFSKIAGPGCRVGWAEGTEKFIYGLSQAGSTRSGGAPSQLMSTFINCLLADGSIAEHLKHTLVPACSRRCSALSSAIHKHLSPLGTSFDRVSGGYFVWLKLPEPLTACAVADAALDDENLLIAAGNHFAVSDCCMSDRVRLCFMWEDEERLEEGVRRLARVLARLLR